MVSSLAAAILDVGLDAANHRLDREHYAHIRPMALARARAAMGPASWLGRAGGIRMRGSGWCHDRIAPAHARGVTAITKRSSSIKPGGPTRNLCIQKSGSFIQGSISSIHPGASLCEMPAVSP